MTVTDMAKQAVDILYQHFEFSFSPQEALIISVAAPEVIRYDQFSNFLETTALELLYVNHGKQTADFSIGFFQMKPSFIEKLEEKICQYQELAPYKNLLFEETLSGKAKRLIRLKRLKSLKFQRIYLQLFYEYVNIYYHRELHCMDFENRIDFIATVYNVGLDIPSESIYTYMENKLFPYGPTYAGQQVSFGQLSVSIYQTLTSRSCQAN